MDGIRARRKANKNGNFREYSRFRKRRRDWITGGGEEIGPINYNLLPEVLQCRCWWKSKFTTSAPPTQSLAVTTPKKVRGLLQLLWAIRMMFGFSVGDFVTVGKLIFQVGSVLRDSKGASVEYQDFLLRLDTLVRTLRIAELSIRSGRLPPSTANAIWEHLGQCSEHLRRFKSVIEKHKKFLSREGSGSKIKDCWRNIGWALFTREEIKGIDDAIRGDIEAISLMLGLCGV